MDIYVLGVLRYYIVIPYKEWTYLHVLVIFLSYGFGIPLIF